MKSVFQKIARVLGGYPILVQVLIILGLIWVVNRIINLVVETIFGTTASGKEPVSWWRLNIFDWYAMFVTGKRPDQ